jgi:hypothetical protein
MSNALFGPDRIVPRSFEQNQAVFALFRTEPRGEAGLDEEVARLGRIARRAEDRIETRTVNMQHRGVAAQGIGEAAAEIWQWNICGGGDERGDSGAASGPRLRDRMPQAIDIQARDDQGESRIFLQQQSELALAENE